MPTFRPFHLIRGQHLPLHYILASKPWICLLTHVLCIYLYYFIADTHQLVLAVNTPARGQSATWNQKAQSPPRPSSSQDFPPYIHRLRTRPPVLSIINLPKYQAKHYRVHPIW